MSKPLIHGDFLYIATAERAYGDTNPQLLCFNKKTGVQSWATALPTVFNYYAPVMYKDYVFVNSAVFLKKYNIQGGVDTSYGMFDGSSEYSDNATNRFENTIYHQMLADDNNIYIGDERGTIYCLQLNKYGDVKNADITDPNNTFVNNPKVFEWTFQHPEFTFQKNETAFLFNESYITEMKTGAADKSCIFSLDKDSGKEQWKVVIEDDLVDLYLSGNKLTTQNGKSIFVISASDGQLVHKIDIPADFTPVSNIDIKNDDTLFFLSASGVVKYNIKTKAFEVILHEKFDIDGQPYNQISYYAK